MGALHSEWNDLLNEYDGIILKAPRDHLKTFFFSEMFSLRQALQHAGTKINIYSKSDKLAGKILRRIKTWAEMPYYQSILKGANIDNKMEIVFGNKSEISAGGYWTSARGEHPDIIIMDDVIDSSVIYSDEQNLKAKERFASEILPTAEPHTKIIIVGTLQRDDDLYSIDSTDTGRKWINKTYDAIVDEAAQTTLYPEKWPWEALMTRKRQISEMGIGGTKWFDKEYRNLAPSLAGEIISPKWHKTYTEKPKGEYIRISGWDLSTGKKENEGDWTAKATIDVRTVNGLPEIYIADAFRGRLDFSRRVRALLNHGQREQPQQIKVEDNVFQADTVQMAKKNSTLNIIGVKTTQNKLEKYNQMLVPLFEQGRIYFKADDPVQAEMWRELCSLPRGMHDDMCDALCIALKDLDIINKASDYLIIE